MVEEPLHPCAHFQGVYVYGTIGLLLGYKFPARVALMRYLKNTRKGRREKIYRVQHVW